MPTPITALNAEALIRSLKHPEPGKERTEEEVLAVKRTIVENFHLAGKPDWEIIDELKKSHVWDNGVGWPISES